MISLAGAAALQLHAQPASPELQGKALELLHQTLQQDRQNANAVPAAGQPMSADQQQRAVEMLRQEIGAERATMSTSGGAPKKASSANSKKNTKPAAASTNAPAMMAPAGQPADGTSVPVQAAGPKTKQQKLDDLLELYKADKLTPAQYHAERAKILAGP